MCRRCVRNAVVDGAAFDIVLLFMAQVAVAQKLERKSNHVPNNTYAHAITKRIKPTITTSRITCAMLSFILTHAHTHTNTQTHSQAQGSCTLVT